MNAPESQYPKLPWIKSPTGSVEIYSNIMHLTWTLDDVRVRLGQIVTSPDSMTPGAGYKGVNEERAAVTFSWRNAKLLRDELATLIARYEKVNGEIETATVLAPNSSEAI